MKLLCKPKLVERSHSESNRIIFEVLGIVGNNDTGEPYPTTIAMHMGDDLHTERLFNVLDGIPFMLILERPEVKLPPPVVSGEPDKPLYKDKYTETLGSVRLKFIRSEGHPNPNFYNVFYGKLDVGYVCKSQMVEDKWLFCPTLLSHSTIAVEQFNVARSCLTKTIWDILTGEMDG